MEFRLPRRQSLEIDQVFT